MAEPSSAGQPGSPARKRRWTLKRLGLWAVCLLVGASIAGELAARYIIGLGDPPLFRLDADMEYVLVPNQHCRRFRHDYDVNRWSMRAADFPEHKAAGELRVLVIGDSIVNGGGKIDQNELATERLRSALAAKTGKPVVVGNASAPSWGPPNELAYIKKFGVLDADIVILVLNSEDYADVPGLEYIGSGWPRSKPTLALQELIGVYGWRALCHAIGKQPEPPPPARTATHEEDIEQCRRAFAVLAQALKASGTKFGVVQYLRRSEVTGTPTMLPGFAVIQGWAKDAGVEPLSAGTAFRESIDIGLEPYQEGDGVHPNARGHELLGGVLLKAVEQLQTK